MQRRARNVPEGADEPEFPILRGAIPMFPAPPVRAANPPPPRNFRRNSARLRAESPDTAIEYDQKELDALKRMREVAERQIKGLSLINDMRKDTSFVVVDDDVRAVREAEERYLIKELDAHLKAIDEGRINRPAMLLIMSPLCNYIDRLEIEVKNTRNLLSDIKNRQADLAAELEHVESIFRILERDSSQNNDQTKS
ncbi:hypothetical protein RB195_000136 [Necator americanus]|uniref:Uncharacterized protein n=2 Tax=Necator americanus TaxID=51031 RepID=A0ABR1DB50_NECAM|nr:hypothetical protein NECAME_13065 [Necator americanus]ETN74304.1 hypothetical protein NECAME_13065 [Necator americanus]